MGANRLLLAVFLRTFGRHDQCKIRIISTPGIRSPILTVSASVLFPEFYQAVSELWKRLLQLGQQFTSGADPGDDAHRTLGALNHPIQEAEEGPAPPSGHLQLPLLLNGAWSGRRSGPKHFSRTKDDLRAG